MSKQLSLPYQQAEKFKELADEFLYDLDELILETENTNKLAAEFCEKQLRQLNRVRKETGV